MSAPLPKRVFKLRKTVKCHSADIRGVAAYNGGFVTGSRDKQARAFLPSSSTNGFDEVGLFTGPTHFVSCVLTVQQGNEVVIYVGSNDENIYCYSPEAGGVPLAVLNGHTGTVCGLAANDRGALLSASWDKTARIWIARESTITLIGHTAAVWAVAFIGESPLTASADKTIKMWSPKGDCIRTFSGHTDVVRGLVVLNESVFLSCGNDASIRQWQTNSNDTKATFFGHDNYVYAISLFPNNETPEVPEYITCSEDRTVKVWLGDTAVQTIRLPASTLWDVAALDEANFAVAGANGTVYIFTSDPSKEAPADEQLALESEVSKSSIPMTDLGEIKVEQLPGPAALLVPGRKDGVTKIIKDGREITCYQWSGVKGEWLKVGDVVGAAGASKDPSQKVEFEGVMYDFVFSVDIEDGKPPLKLPYNVGQNPWEAAQNFLHRNELPQGYLDQVANFIVTNSKGVTLDSGSNELDPMTADGAYRAPTGRLDADYVPQSANVDPFTGGSSYSTSTPANPRYTPPTPGASTLFPISTYLTFESANVEGIAKKLKEFATVVPSEVQVSVDDLKELLKLADTKEEITPKQIALLKLMTTWPTAHIFPVLDLLRLCLLLPKVNQELSSSKDAARLMDTLLVSASDQQSTPNQMLALRALSNLFSDEKGEVLVSKHVKTILDVVTEHCTKSANKQVQIALASLLINISILLKKPQYQSSLGGTKVDTLTGITSSIAKEKVDAEAAFRLFVALGNIIHGDKDLLDMAKSAEVVKAISQLTNRPESAECPAKLITCGRQLLAILSPSR